MAPWETLPHATDLRVRVWGRDRAALFRDGARSLFELSARPRDGWPAALESRGVEVAAPDATALFRRFLSECLFEFESDGFLARDVTILRLDETSCSARLEGACFAPDELVVDHVIKAVTWHGLEIRDAPDGVSAEVLHDL